MQHLLTDVISSGRRRIMLKEKNQAMKTDVETRTLCLAMFPNVFSKHSVTTKFSASTKTNATRAIS